MFPYQDFASIARIIDAIIRSPQTSARPKTILGFEAVVPNPNLKLPIREVMSL
jgi:hypothetical protein